MGQFQLRIEPLQTPKDWIADQALCPRTNRPTEKHQLFLIEFSTVVRGIRELWNLSVGTPLRTDLKTNLTDNLSYRSISKMAFYSPSATFDSESSLSTVSGDWAMIRVVSSKINFVRGDDALL